jgi:transcriptional regulator with PAS, ATPase and Fis domain
MLSYSTDGIMLMNDRFIIEMMNPLAGKVIKEIFGYRLEEGACLKDKILMQSIREVIRDKLPLRDQIYGVGMEETLLYNVFPIIFNGSVSGVIVSFRKAKEIIQSEKKIRNELNQKGCTAKYKLDDIKGESAAILHCKYLAKKFGMFDSNVLIQGETGTGKELFAQAIHNCGRRINGPFYGINCTTFPENLLESELFGYSDGAFTGAVKGGKAGLFELAHGGTIFLDEIGEMPMAFQNKLLRVLQEKEIRRMGDDKVVSIDTRIIAASHNDLEDNVNKGRFREDLYYRLNVLNLVLPSLNERPNDIPILIKHMIDFYRSEFNLSYEIEFSGAAMAYLKRHRWRGNVRELGNFAERICIYSEEGKTIHIGIAENVLKGFSSAEKNTNGEEKACRKRVPGDVLNEKVYDLIRDAVERFDGNKSKAADYLGVSRTYIWRKLKEVEGHETRAN